MAAEVPIKFIVEILLTGVLIGLIAGCVLALIIFSHSHDRRRIDRKMDHLITWLNIQDELDEIATEKRKRKGTRSGK